ncbi:MAG: transglutaminase domain-containing protein [Acidobacteria bacterium]|nr:transglutaminase domain-containing protein [Acidobacteriota bacterium]
MRFVPRLLLCLFFLPPLLWGQPLRFRTWLAGTEAGASEIHLQSLPEGLQHEAREWLELARGAARVRQEGVRTALKQKDGAIRFQWSQKVAQEPLGGTALWRPDRPGFLRVEPRGGKPRDIPVPSEALVWPGDLDARLKRAAKDRLPVRLQVFNPEAEGWDELDLQCDGPAPLPGWPDAIRFHGRLREGALQVEAEVWVSPRDGELRQAGLFMGMPVLVQRAELPPPDQAPGADFFQRSQKRIPRHPFLLWLPELTVRWTGGAAPDLPADPQQERLDSRRLRLRQAPEPTAEERAQGPVTGKADPVEAPFLEATPLLPFRDPAFDGVLYRLAPPPGATRWDLARLVTAFVFDWIARKDYSVGFANAAEVCRNPVGDCTEHGVLAAALLRRLGVPARGAMGWVAAEDTLALHFWVEVRLRDRWVPVDPTFDQAPASAFRVRLGSTDLSNLATVGWDGAAQVFGSGQWVPEREGELPWNKGYYIEGDFVSGPGIGRLTLPGGRWNAERGHLTVELFGTVHDVEASTRPESGILQGATRMRNPETGLQGWHQAEQRMLWLDLGGRWLRFSNLRPQEGSRVLHGLEYARPAPQGHPGAAGLHPPQDATGSPGRQTSQTRADTSKSRSSISGLR